MKKSFIAIFSALAVSSAFADTVITALPPSGAPMPAAATVISAPTPESTKLTLAVSGVDVLAGLKKNEALDRVQQAMDSQLISAFASARKFKVLARSDWKSVLKEQDFAASGNVEPATAAKVGKALGAKYILQTTIDDFQDYIETATFAAINKTAQKRVIRFGAVAKLYDSTTGEIVETANFVITNNDIADLPSYSVRNSNLNDALIGDIARLMAKKVADRITDIAYPAKVLSVMGNQIIINRGDSSDIAVGRVYRILALGKPMVDPDTGEVLGRAEADVGKAVVTEVLPKFSKANLTENFGVEAGNIARAQK